MDAKEENLSPNFVTFAGYGQMRRNGVLAKPVGNACSHTTMVDKAQTYCEAMVMSVDLYADQHARMEEDGGTLGLSLSSHGMGRRVMYVCPPFFVVFYFESLSFLLAYHGHNFYDVVRLIIFSCMKNLY